MKFKLRFRCFFDYGQNVSRWILEPGNGGTIATHNAFLVCLEIGQIIDLEADPSPRQFIDRTIDIFTGKFRTVKVAGTWLGFG